jgi:hypothetical protein
MRALRPLPRRAAREVFPDVAWLHPGYGLLLRAAPLSATPPLPRLTAGAVQNAQDIHAVRPDLIVDDVGITHERQPSHARALRYLLRRFRISCDVIECAANPRLDVSCPERTALRDVGEDCVQLGESETRETFMRGGAWRALPRPLRRLRSRRA